MSKEITAPLSVALRYEGNLDVVYHQNGQQPTVTQYNYHADRLAVWGKNPGFLKDPKFIKAYEAGYMTNHNFKNTDPDLRWRGHVYTWAAMQAQHLEGDFVECGVNAGIFSKSICHYLDFNSLDKKFFLLDTYEGIPVEQMTEAEKNGMPAWHNQHSYTTPNLYEQVKADFALFKGAQVIKGKVPDTLSQVTSDKICYLSIDMGIVHPELATLEYFWDKLVPGAVVVINHYAFAAYNELQKAHDAFVAKHKQLVLNLPTGQGVIIKV
jgi:O-methyltransferase